ncbi:MAG: helix-turn-helix transcriptional regulator [Lachnospiraceae bacterium]|nr:helix-turn-helix transcriptional regulator [Lachnospiraceae bacterium]
MDAQFIRDRLSKLQREKQVSERKMSFALGHSSSYIRSITSGRALPSMKEFLYICDYLEISPAEFFSEHTTMTPLQQKAINHICKMSDSDLNDLIAYIEHMDSQNPK